MPAKLKTAIKEAPTMGHIQRGHLATLRDMLLPKLLSGDLSGATGDQ